LLLLNEFEELTNLKDVLRFHKIIFARNCLTWIGASLLTNFDKTNFKQMGVTKEEYEINSELLDKILKINK
jgi:actin-related protein